MDLTQLFEEIQKRIKFLGVNSREIAAESGYNWSTIHKWLHNKRNIRVSQLIDLLQTLGLTIRLEVDEDDHQERRD